ncbi:phage tail protein [Pseudomonas laurylsulfatiphila]|uniref:phage tail protein n=1 Tax=Pseudomonas laurylsulfatiphila TaxID=2011015 RepID=UPI002160838F|nr:phage tail protein [Pseudomonas laurylsulfatiphila]UVM06411.1 phage tail protein [Pseudomonas laurylsulfatiphila]
MFASKSTRGFYDPRVHASMPPDATELPEGLHAELLVGLSAGKQIDWDSQALPVLIDPPPVVLTVEQLCASIDKAADAAREMVAGDPLRAFEYQTAATEARAFKEAGYPANAVPRGVAAWAINGRTAEQAAADILAKATAFEEAIYDLRETRLRAKESLRLLMADGDVTNAQQLTDNAISDIQALTAGVSGLL